MGRGCPRGDFPFSFEAGLSDWPCSTWNNSENKGSKWEVFHVEHPSVTPNSVQGPKWNGSDKIKNPAENDKVFHRPALCQS